MQSRCRWGRGLIQRLDWGRRVCFQDGSLTWLWVGGLSSSPCGPCHTGLLQHPYNMAAGFPQSEGFRREHDGRYRVFTSLPQKSPPSPLYICVCVCVTSVIPIQDGRGPRKGVNTGRQGALGPSWRLATTAQKHVNIMRAGPYLFCSLLCLQFLEQCLAHNTFLIHFVG